MSVAWCLCEVAGKEGNAMVEILGIVVLVILLAPFFKEKKYKEMERQKDMRRAMMKLQDKYRHNSL
jgi:membrane protein insertase Oxa1/YidC/SpoIIIJ